MSRNSAVIFSILGGPWPVILVESLHPLVIPQEAVIFSVILGQNIRGSKTKHPRNLHTPSSSMKPRTQRVQFRRVRCTAALLGTPIGQQLRPARHFGGAGSTPQATAAETILDYHMQSKHFYEKYSPQWEGSPLALHPCCYCIRAAIAFPLLYRRWPGLEKPTQSIQNYPRS